uniref:Protein MIZU-KUSSEI 1 n=1 Tax=Ananas comosus var. bracteatus TaxID=296719 RepID=A0A6V7NGB1_ANACO|nr:unnamed protein product [Ananas comosus var. bracteatus]
MSWVQIWPWDKGSGIRVPRVHRIHAIDARTRHRLPNPADSFATPLPRWSISSNTSSAPRAQPLPSSLGSIVVATVFGLRLPGARIHLAIQPHPRSPPLAVIELATTTGAFMADIASGPLNFVLQCATRGGRDAPPLWEEARWAQFCNGRVSGSARRRGGGDADAVDLRVTEMLEHVSFGAGILPDYFEGTGTGTGTGTVDLVYMRARYERVVRSKDAEVLSMLGSEVKGYPEISFNLIRV